MGNINDSLNRNAANHYSSSSKQNAGETFVIFSYRGNENSASLFGVLAAFSSPKV